MEQLPSSLNVYDGSISRPLESKPEIERAKLAGSLNLTVMLLFVGYVGYYFCRNNISAAFPLLSQQFGFSNAQLGIIAAYSELSYSLAKFICGALADKFGGKRLFMLGMLGAIIFNVLFSMGSQLWYFVSIWCCCRVFLSMGWGGMANIVSLTCHKKSFGKVMGFLSLSFIVGGIVSTLFAGFLVDLGVSWQGIFLYPALILFTVMLICQKLIKQPKTVVVETKKHSKARLEIGAFKQLLKKRAFIYLMVFSFFTTFLRSIFTVWMPKMFFDLGSSASNAIWDSTLFLFLGAASTMFVGYYVDKASEEGRAKVMVRMLCMLVVCLIMTYWQMISAEVNINILVCIIGVSGFFLIGPYSMAAGVLSLDIGKQSLSGSCTGFVDGVGYFGGACALWLAGVVADRWGWDDVILGLVVISLGAVFSAYLLALELLREKP